MNYKFCENCGSLRDFSSIIIDDNDKHVIPCDMCGTTMPAEELKNIVHRTFKSYQTTISTTIRAGASQQNNEVEDFAMINEVCGQCGNDVMKFYTMQLRSADEGQTVFYECPKCGYKTNQNN